MVCVSWCICCMVLSLILFRFVCVTITVPSDVRSMLVHLGRVLRSNDVRIRHESRRLLRNVAKTRKSSESSDWPIKLNCKIVATMARVPCVRAYLPHFSMVFRTSSADGSLRSYAQPIFANNWIQKVVMLKWWASSAAL